MTSLASQPRRPVLLALVLAAHAALLLGWRLADRLQARPSFRDGLAPLVMLRLPAPPLHAPEPVPQPAAPARQRRQDAGRALQAPAAAAAPAAAPLAAPGIAAPEPPASAPPPLRLALPPRAGMAAGRNPALDDPRANTAPRTVESHIAAVTGDGRWTEELLPDGRRRYRRGAECTVVQPMRAEALFPFADKPPPVVGDC